MKSPIPLLRKIFPLTLRGIFFLFLSLVILLFGIMRADLAGLFWGTSFLSLSVYALLGNHLFHAMSRRHHKLNPQAINVSLPVRGIFPGNEATCEIQAHTITFFVPGFLCQAKVDLLWPNRPPLTLGARLASGRNVISIRFNPQHRGTYRTGSLDFIFSDYLGFTRSELPFNAEEYVRVYPKALPAEEIRQKITGEESDNTLKTRKQSDELLEVKKYFPGDDLRKLNWKIFAHLGELFVRKGEETPPPESRLYLMLDPSLPEALPELNTADYLDELVEAYSSVALQFLNGGIQVHLSVLGKKTPYLFTKNKSADFLALMSEIGWIDDCAEIPPPPARKMHTVVFSLPGSRLLPRILKGLPDAKNSATVLFREYRIPVREKSRFSPARILFVPASKEKKKYFSRAEEEAYRQLLITEISKYKNPPWSVANVKAI